MALTESTMNRSMNGINKMALIREVETFLQAQQQQKPLPAAQSFPPHIMQRLAQQYQQRKQQQMQLQQLRLQQQQQQLVPLQPLHQHATLLAPKRSYGSMMSALSTNTPPLPQHLLAPSTSMPIITASAAATAAAATVSGAMPPKKRSRKAEASSQNARPLSRAKPPAESPAKFVLRTFVEHGCDLEQHTATQEKLQVQPSQSLIENYTQDKLNAVRHNNMEELERLHRDGVQLGCCNKFGESIVHLACRRGLTKILHFLIHKAGVSLHHADDYKRTPMHDACWTPEPNFDLLDLLLKEAPDQLVMKDVRGFTPFDYVRKSDWATWMDFLKQRKHLLRPKASRPPSPPCPQSPSSVTSPTDQSPKQ